MLSDMYEKTSLAGHDHAEKPKKEIDHIKVRKVKGGHVMTHVHKHPMHHPDEDHATQGTDNMVSHMLEHASEPNPGEAEADAGQSGIADNASAPAMPNMQAGGGAMGA